MKGSTAVTQGSITLELNRPLGLRLNQGAGSVNAVGQRSSLFSPKTTGLETTSQVVFPNLIEMWYRNCYPQTEVAFVADCSTLG
jgi:hypothetical protein